MKFDRRSARATCALPTAAVLLVVAAAAAVLQAHGTEARYVEILRWKRDHFSRVFGVNRTHLELVLPNANTQAEVKTIEGKSCVVGDLIAFDVDDQYAFDIDEPVKLTLNYASELTTPFLVGWDKSGGTGQGVTEEIIPDTSPAFASITLTLDRARLAGQGTQGSDIAISSRNGFALCDIELARSGTTSPPKPSGQVRLVVKDAKTGGLVPARVGVYDSTGRAPLPSEKSLMLQRFADDLRMLAVNERTFWPSANRQAFYVDGNYEASLPEGSYELVVTRGPEFRAYHGKFDVKAGNTSTVTATLERYADFPGRGWVSGDSHIHVTRDEVDDPNIWAFVAAEDVYVGNLLEMGNIAGLHFKQPAAWGKASRFERDGHFVVSGQEDPRTGHLGHTIHHNLERPIRLEAEEYFMYPKVFDDSHKQGGISGFAHMGGTATQTNRGLDLTVPFGQVDFIEVLQRGRFFGDVWYRFLNLGYKITPAAGSDFPYSDFPGIVRNYVKMSGPFNLDAWFASFKAGHVYVTNGPFLEFTVNGTQMGEELHVKSGTRLDAVAEAQMNPDVDKLDRLELVVLGDVAATVPANGQERVSLRHGLTADRSMWIAVRAFGGRQDPQNMTIAHSAPIYVVVDGEPTWKREAVPALVAEQRTKLHDLLTVPIDPRSGPEAWDTRTLLAEQWELQRPKLRPRIVEADALYAKLLSQLRKFSTPAR